MLTHRGDERVGRIIDGRYRLIALIGSGGQARVYLADDVRLRRQVAIKMLHAGLARNRAFLRRFTAEAHAVAAVSHPNLLAVYDHGEDDEGPYLVTEYLAGGSLRSLLDVRGTVTPSQGIKLALQAVAGLRSAHGRGLIHRDLKPANLLFGDDERLRIADFGLVRALHEASLTEPDARVQGTSRYLPPEAGTFRSLDEKSDVYSLALTVVEAMTGEVPLAGGSPEEVLARRRTVSSVELPENLGPARWPLQLALLRDPDRRPTALELGQRLLTLTRSYQRPAPLQLVPTLSAADVDSQRTAFAPAIVSPRPDEAAVPESRSRSRGRDGRDERRPRRWPRIVAATVAVVALTAAAVFVAERMIAGTEDPIVLSELGSWRGESIAGLESYAVTAGWELRQTRQFDDAIEADLIISTDPAGGPGVEFGPGQVIAVVVSDGPAPVDLVDVRDLMVNDAVDTLTDAGFEVGSQDRINDETVPADTVMAVLVDGVTVTSFPLSSAPGTRVDLVVSAGPEERTVPEVRGATEVDAIDALDPLGLNLVVGESVFSETVEAGRIVDQAPLPTTLLAKGGIVEVTVSRGPDRREVPTLAGLTIDQATAALADRGLALGQVFGPPDAEVIVGYASGQGVGSRHAPNTAIDVVVGFPE